MANLPPHVRESATSEGAAISKKAQREAEKDRLEVFVKAQGIAGTTCDNAETKMGPDIHQSLSARFNDLVRDQKIFPTIRPRKTRWGKNAFIYVHVDWLDDRCYVILVGHSRNTTNGASGTP